MLSSVRKLWHHRRRSYLSATTANYSHYCSDFFKQYNLEPPPEPRKKKFKPRWNPPSSLDMTDKRPARSAIPFDFRFTYTEANTEVQPIALREPKFSPFGPGRLARVWTGLCAPVVDPEEVTVETEKELEERRKKMYLAIQGEPLNNAERKELVYRCRTDRTNTQVNLGRDGLTHNILVNIQSHFKRYEVIRIKCVGVPTVDMKNVCYQLEDKSFGKIIFRKGKRLVLYRGRNHLRKDMHEVPLMLWKPHDPVYPKLIKSTIDGLTIKETKEMRKKGLAVPVLTKLEKNGYYGRLVHTVQGALLFDELVRIDCTRVPVSDYKKIGLKLRDMVPCILVTFDNDQIVVWRGKDYKPTQGKYFLTELDTFDDTPDNHMASHTDEEELEDTRS